MFFDRVEDAGKFECIKGIGFTRKKLSEYLVPS